MEYVIETTDGGFFVENGLVFQDERGSTMLIARFDSNQKAEQYLRKKMSNSAKPKTKKTKKTSGKYEQKKRRHHR